MVNSTPPVLFLTYRRFDTAQRVFEAIRTAKPSKLYFASNAPNSSIPRETDRVGQVRALTKQVDWDCELKVRFLKHHLPVKASVSSSIDWFFSEEEMGIILEDDCLPSQSFFCFAQELLEKFQYDERIGLICGTNLSEEVGYADSYYFSRYPHIWGWASWRRVWKKYDVNMTQLEKLKASEIFKRSFINTREFKYWIRIFESVREGKINTWDAQVTYLALTNSMFSVYPSVNLVSNIGFGLEAMHTKDKKSPLANRSIAELKMPLSHPQFLIADLRAESIRKDKEGIALAPHKRILRRIRASIGI